MCLHTPQSTLGEIKHSMDSLFPSKGLMVTMATASKNSIICSSIHAGAVDRMVINIPISRLNWIFKQHCGEKGYLKIAPTLISEDVSSEKPHLVHILSHIQGDFFLIFSFSLTTSTEHWRNIRDNAVFYDLLISLQNSRKQPLPQNRAGHWVWVQI